MLASELIQIVKTGNLSETKVTDASLVNFLNLGLKKIYDKFSLKIVEEIYIVDDSEDYSLPKDYINYVRVTSPKEFYRDNFGNFKYYPNKEFELSVNVYGDYNGILITDYNTLKVEYPIIGQTIKLTYKAFPKPFTDSTLNSELKIRDQYLEPLIDYMTYLGFVQNGGGTQADSNIYLNRYELAVNNLILNGSINRVSSLNTKFHDRGYV